MEPLQPDDPEVLGRFRLQARLGSGGMGRVYLASTPEGRRAAVKVIRDDLAGDTGFRHRFRREVSAALSVAGLFTARVLDADPEGNPPWLATEYVTGSALRDAVVQHGPMPVAQVTDVARGLAEALAAIHAAGLVHRDLKPANVLLSPDGPKVIDFGIAWSAGSTQLTGTGQAIGTPEYMAPEQIAGTGRGGPPIDVFALGSTLVFASTGRSPFEADQAAVVLYRIMQLEPDLRGVPAPLLDLVRSCLAKDPAQRPTAQQIAVALRGGQPIGTRPTVPGPPPDNSVPPRGRRRIAVLAAVAAVALVAAVIAATVALWPRSPATPTTDTVAAGPTPAGPTPSVLTTIAPTIDPASQEARYVDRLCSTADLLIGLGDDSLVPQPTGDLVLARRDFLTSMDRVIGITDTALPDFVVLRDDAPNAEVRQAFAAIVDEFTSARQAFGEAKATVDAVDPLTIEAYDAGIDRFSDGVRNLALASTLMENVKLPKEYTAASAGAAQCND